MKVVCIKRIILPCLIFFLISSTYAINDIQITPSNPKVGDAITLTGKANPNENINCQAWFEVTPTMSDTYYGYIMSNVEIPTTPNNFKVIAEDVNRLSVSVKMGIWITKSANANSDGIATVSQSNVPVGTYDIKIGGTIKDPSKPVKLKIIASTTIKADENGNFEYSYRANGIPEGTVVHLNIGGVSNDILIEGDMPTPPTEENTTISQTNTNLDREPPNIRLISPTNRVFNHSTITFDIFVDDASPYSVVIYLNGEKINYDVTNSRYTGSLSLKEGENFIKIIAEDENGNINKKILCLTYQKAENKELLEKPVNSTNNKVEKENPASLTNKITATNNPKPETNTNDNLKEKGNIIEGMIIKNIGETTRLIIQDGTRMSKEGEIQIREVTLPNVTLAYYISPKDAEFSIPLTLKVKIEKSQIKKLITTDTIDNSKKIKNSNKIEIISLAPMISEAMQRIANSTSVSSLFK